MASKRCPSRADQVIVLELELDGVLLGRVACHDVDMVSVLLGGTCTGEEFATIDAHSSKFAASGEHGFLIQLDSVEFAPGQALTIRFVESDQPCLAGKSIAERYPDEEEAPEAPFDFDETRLQVLREARARAPRHAGYAFAFEIPERVRREGKSSAGDHGFSADVHWAREQPERVQVDVRTWSLDDIENGPSGRTLVKDYLSLGESARIRVDVLGQAA
jgi:hypothetical protein